MKQKKQEEISRKEAIKKIGNYGKYAALTALATYMILNPKKAQAASPSDPGTRVLNLNLFFKKPQFI
ncbi:MAG: hypothetical protein ABF260_09870 [Flavobacteriaceae bacterium]